MSRETALKNIHGEENLVEIGVELMRPGFVANDFVTLNDGGNANPRRTISRGAIHSNYFPGRADEHFRSASNFRGESQCDIEFRTGAGVLFEHEVQTTRGNIARLSVVLGNNLLDGHSNVHGK